ncbi:hypothetical protein CG401_02160, partial [Bifidobacteriaceae bacterium NR019]
YHLYDEFHVSGGTRKVLSKVKQGIATHYSQTHIRVDRLVVVVKFSNYKFEVQPVFEQDDGSFSYPKKEIRNRRDEITKALNREFRDSDSESDNRLMVGSWGRCTAINGVSDLDFLYIL